MDEYIKRETAVRMVMAAKWGDGSDGAMAMEIVASAPAADVAPVVHAKWDDHHCTACGCQAVTFKNPSGETIYVETPRCPAC